MSTRRDFILSLLGIVCAVSNVDALTLKGVEYIPISRLAQMCGMRYRTTVADKSQVVYSKYSSMEFSKNSRMMTINKTKVWLGHPVTAHKSMLYIAKRDYFKTISPILFPQNNGAPKKLFHIFIDAGHGGKDRGAMNKTYRVAEKAINLDIAMRLGRELQKNGYKVSYSRTKDVALELADRAEMANARKADMFLSLHCNAANPSISGVETFALTPRAMPSTNASKITKSEYIKYEGHANDEWNEMLAYYIQRALKTYTRSPDRGVKRARFAVLKPVKMPAALIELGFISNNQECAKLMSSKYRQFLAQTISNAVINYHNTLRRLSKKR